MTTGLFKGSMRETLLSPPEKDSTQVRELMGRYLHIICNIRHHKDIVFADENPTKEQDIYSLVRRDILTGIVPDDKGRYVHSRNQ